jgi:hypothetical protein
MSLWWEIFSEVGNMMFVVGDIFGGRKYEFVVGDILGGRKYDVCGGGYF